MIWLGLPRDDSVRVFIADDNVGQKIFRKRLLESNFEVSINFPFE